MLECTKVLPEMSPDEFHPPNFASLSALMICSGGTDIDCTLRSVKYERSWRMNRAESTLPTACSEWAVATPMIILLPFRVLNMIAQTIYILRGHPSVSHIQTYVRNHSHCHKGEIE